MVNAIINSYQI